MLRKIKLKISEKLNPKSNVLFEKLKNKEVIDSLNEIYKNSNNEQKKYKSLLIDGGYYNLNYYYRLQLLRTALKSKTIKEYAFVWDCNLNTCKNLLKAIGIKNISSLSGSFDKEISLKAENLLKNINSKKDIININLPYNIPGTLLYDTILKRQRCATVNIKDKNLKEYIYKFLYSIKFAEKLINYSKPDLLALSHCKSYQCSPLAWLASKKGISTIVLGNEFNILRLWKISKPNDIYSGIGHPVGKDFKRFSEVNKSKLRSVGKKYIFDRISGNTSDLSGRYAFQGKRKKLSELDLYPKGKKIVAIYSACFFDFPHTYGMKRFIDMLDWLKLTIEKASENRDVLWLLKPHPMEKWYGGVKLTDLIDRKLPENIILIPYDYSGQDIINLADALVTFHGTSAIEYSVMGKPVLVPDRGWYHDCGFVLYPKSREDYENLLTSRWYELVNVEKAKLNAELFSGIFFGIPKWQEGAFFPDESNEDYLRKKLPNFVKFKKDLINKEIKLIKKWVISDSIDYHIFKIENNNKFTTVIKK
tara:strand:+ start:260 stop:1858 length:1599 start_codon:yes stop_codon:yes gene_type:complete